MKKDSLNVHINAVFLDEQSIPEDAIYLWAYHIKIFNGYSEAVTIKKRMFEVVDTIGQKQTIDGIGISNREPVIQSGEIFEYASGVLLAQPSGFFSGYYLIEKADGSEEKEYIPPFSLDSKYEDGKSQ